MSGASVTSELHQQAAAWCDQHQPNGGARAQCLVCAGLKLQSALSRISYLCCAPNEMGISEYDVDFDEDAVVMRVASLRAEVARLRFLWAERETLSAAQVQAITAVVARARDSRPAPRSQKEERATASARHMLLSAEAALHLGNVAEAIEVTRRALDAARAELAAEARRDVVVALRAERHTLRTALVESRRIVQDCLNAMGPCDHDVGICNCDMVASIKESDAALAAKEQQG